MNKLGQLIRLFPNIAGLSSIVLGLTVLFGWVTDNSTLITVFSNFLQMAFNTSIVFVLMGSALFLFSQNKKTGSFFFLIASGIIVGLTASEYLSRQSLFIDEFFYSILHIISTLNPGRMAPNTVAAFSALIISLLLLLQSKPSKWTHFATLLLSEIALAIGLLSLLRYALNIEASYHWTNLTPMGIHTSIGLIVLSLGLISTIINQDIFKKSYFAYHIEVLIGTLGLFLTFSLWNSLLKQEEYQVNRLTQQRMLTFKSELTETLTERFKALHRITNRWEHSSGTNFADWENDVQQYIIDQPDYQGIGWIDSTEHIKWFFPKEGNEVFLNQNLAKNPNIASILKKSQVTGKGQVTSVLTLPSGEKIITYYSPIKTFNGHFNGFISGTYKLNKLLNSILYNSSQNHEISIFENGKLIYGVFKQDKISLTTESPFQLQGIKWVIHVTPKNSMLQELNSPLSKAILFIGIILSLLASLLVQSFNRLKNQSEELFKIKSSLDNTIQYSAIGLALVSLEGKWLKVNQSLVKMLGYLEEELLQTTFQAITHPEDMSADLNNVDRLLSGVIENYQMEKRYLNKNGNYIWIQLNVSLVKDSNDTPKHFIAQIQDITERLQLEEDRNKHALRFQAIFNQTYGYIGLLDINGVILELNQAGLAVGNIKIEDVAGKLFWETDWWPKPEVKQRLKETIVEARNGKFRRFETVSIDPDGNDLFVDFYIKPIFNEQNEVVLLLAEGRDVSEEKKAERALRKNEEKLRAFSENAKDIAIIQLDPSGYIETWSRGAEQIKGYKSEEIVGQHFSVFYPEDLQELNLPQFILDNALRSGSFEDEGWRVKKDGTLFWANIIVTALFDSDKTLLGFLKITRDITEKRVNQEKLEHTHAELEHAYNTLETELKERKVIEKQLVQAQKMDALGILTGGIAHDFNNILWMILGNSELLLERANGDEFYQELTTDIHESALRAKALVKQLLDFSRTSESEKTMFEASALIKETLNMVRSSIPTSIKLQLNTIEPGIILYGDTSKFNQIIVNLCTNAHHAIGDSGSITVSVEKKHITADDIKDSIFKKTGHFLMIDVSDTGSGMSAETIEHIFDPFFTTKGVGKGTGLGLSTIHGIIEDMEGFISVYSDLDMGSSFKVYLPFAKQEGSHNTELSSKPSDRPESRFPNKFRVMVVDDEEMIRKMLKRSLELIGLSVSTFSNGREGLNAYNSNPSDFDLIITDQTMPEMVGITLARRIRKQNPQMPIILASGNASIITEEEIESVSSLKLLNKPIQISELKNIISETLGTTLN